MKTFIVITIPHATFGISLHKGVCVDAPPIARWMKGKPEAEIIKWINGAGGSYKSEGSEILCPDCGGLCKTWTERSDKT